MAIREDEVRHFEEAEEPEVEADSQSGYEDWFWRPIKRHQTLFAEPCGNGTAWRESGRRLQIANRLSSQTESKQARLAYLYERKGDRGNSFRDARNQEKGRTKW